jgi:flagellar biosynthesis protein FlhB
MDKKTTTYLQGIWDFFTDVILEPFLFAFAVFWIFSHIQTIIDFTTANPSYSFWTRLWIDMHINSIFYIVFIVILFIWVFAKGLKYKKEKRNEDQEKIYREQLQQTLKELPDKIAEAIKLSGSKKT